MVFADHHKQGESLFNAAGDGNLREVQALLAQGADVNWANAVRTQWVTARLHRDEDASKYERDFKRVCVCVLSKNVCCYQGSYGDHFLFVEKLGNI